MAEHCCREGCCSDRNQLISNLPFITRRLIYRDIILPEALQILLQMDIYMAKNKLKLKLSRRFSHLQDHHKRSVSLPPPSQKTICGAAQC